MSGSRRGTGEGSIYRRQDGQWAGAIYVTDTADRRIRKVTYGRTRSIVADKLRDIAHAEATGVRTPATKQTLSDYLDHWLHNVAAQRIRPTTLEHYESVIRLYLKPELGHIKLGDLRPRHFQAFVNDRADAGISPRRLQQCQQVLRRALNIAMRDELVRINAAKHADMPVYDRKPVVLWTTAQLRHFLDSTSTHPWYGAFLISALCGLRRGEVLGLAWEDIDFNNDLIHVRRQLQRVPHQGLQRTALKTAESVRDVPMPAEVRFVLSALSTAPTPRDPSSVVFTSSSGTPIDPKNYYKAFVAEAKRAGLPHIALHRLRHIAATMFKDLGADVKEAQALLGHSQVTTTMQIYQHGNSETQRALISSVEQALAGTAATEAATDTALSTGQSTEIAALTPGGPTEARTRDTLLKSISQALDNIPSTPVDCAELRNAAQPNTDLVATKVATDAKVFHRTLDRHPHLPCPFGHDIDWLLRELHDRLCRERGPPGSGHRDA